MEKKFWRGFEFPMGCQLDVQEKDELVEKSKTSNEDPFFFCNKKNWHACPSHLECFLKTLRKKDQKSQK